MPISLNFRNVLVAAVACCERNGHASLTEEVMISLPAADNPTAPEGPSVIRPERALSRDEAVTLCQVRRMIYVNVNGDPPEWFDCEHDNLAAIAALMEPHPDLVPLLPFYRWETLLDAAREPVRHV